MSKAASERPLAVIGSGHAGMAGIINTLVDIAKTHSSKEPPREMLVVNTREKQPSPDTAYPLNGIKPDDMHPFYTDKPPAGFPTFGQYVREMSKEDPSLKSALRAPTYNQVTAYMEFMTELAIIAAGEKVDMKANRKAISSIDQKTRNGPATINFRDGTELVVTPVFAGPPPHLGGIKPATPASLDKELKGTAANDFGKASKKSAKPRTAPKPKRPANG